MDALIAIIENIAAAVEAILNAVGLATPDFVKSLLTDLKKKVQESDDDAAAE